MYNSKTVAGFLLAGILMVGGMAAMALESDAVARYYWEKAGIAAQRFNPNVPGVSYRLSTKSYRHSVGEGGRITRSDSAQQSYYFQDGRLDSVITEHGKAGRFEEVDLVAPNLFDLEFDLTLFPNDTGGPRLAIGLWSDSTRPIQPEGLLVIDRYDYFARALYLHFPAEPGFKRYTRSLHYRMVDSLLFPDSVWVVATKYGIFFTESFRLETDITDIEILSNNPAPAAQ